jgi:hypothetical protein
VKIKAMKFKDLKEKTYQLASHEIMEKCRVFAGEKNINQLKRILAKYYGDIQDLKGFFHNYVRKMINNGLIKRLKLGYYVMPIQQKDVNIQDKP